MADDLDDRGAALEAQATELMREEVEGGTPTLERVRARSERLTALLIRARDAGLSNGEIAEMLDRVYAEVAPEDANHDAFGMTDQDVMEWIRDHEGTEHEFENRRSAIWGGATLGLLVGLILGFFVGTSYWRTLLIAILIGAGAGIASNMLAWLGNRIARRGKAER